MRVFVAGASGVIGRPLVPRLVEARHEVVGMTRRDERAAEIRQAGAEAVVCDVFDAAALTSAVTEARPEVVIHELTALPPKLDPRDAGVYEANNRIRREGTANLVAAARAAGARRMVAQSIAFVYAPIGDWVKDEEASVMQAEGRFGDAVDAAMELERQVVNAEGIEGVVLRYGFFYGPGSSYASDGYQASEVRRRRLPVVGKGDATFSFIHVDDAAAATVIAAERGEPGIYNITDDDPAPMREWVPAYAAALGARPPRTIPVWLARLIAGKEILGMATVLRGASNAKAKRELGWQPAHASWREGFRDALG
jgi:nucleoside-diphosphate-sugar epimerase